jgi:hypothetical protein
MKVTVYIGKDAPRTPSVEALRFEHTAMISEVKAMTFALIQRTGWSKDTAIRAMEHIILAYEIGIWAREKKDRAKGLEALGKQRREVCVLTGDERAAALVDNAFLYGWKRNKPRPRNAPKKTAGATFVELVSGRGRLDKQERYRLRKRLITIAQELLSRSR